MRRGAARTIGVDGCSPRRHGDRGESADGTGNQLNWRLAGNTTGFGNVADGRPFWTGQFAGSSRNDILFYYPGDGNWWLGTFSGNTLNWGLAGNTSGARAGDPNFGNLTRQGIRIWPGKFSGATQAQMLFNYAGDGNWWLGTFTENQLHWNLAGNTHGFGNLADGRPFWTGDFAGDVHEEILFYYPGDSNWWLGTFSSNQLSWSLAGNTSGFGNLTRAGITFWSRDFAGSGKRQQLFQFAGDANWWLGTFAGNQLQWALDGNTAGFGGSPQGCPNWAEDFIGLGRAEVLFYDPGDGNWWIGHL